MSDNELSWFRESFKEIKESLLEMNAKLDKKSDYLQARAEENHTEIMTMKENAAVRAETMRKLQADLDIASNRLDKLELCGQNTLQRVDCEAIRKHCLETRQKGVDNKRNWLLFAFAAIQVLFAAAVIIDKFF